ncbi:MAG: methyltransferase [Chloroflexi bacterium RBG_19FT_COMBO_62_14]|nr:MAG: methyltransferase [Chloroflexi bacterium RBG_19FT_COMBO_62_14]
MTTLEAVFEAVLEGDAESCRLLTERGIQEGLNPESILGEALIPAMREVGARFERQEYYVPEMLVAARAMQAGLTVLRPLLVERNFKPMAKVAIGTVRGDLHDIGKNLVGMMMEGAGLEVVDLGIDTPPERFVEAVRGGAQVVGMSALLTTTMMNMRLVIQALTEAGLRQQVKVIIGGAPLNGAFAEEIGADGYAPDASQAVSLVKGLLNLA